MSVGLIRKTNTYLKTGALALLVSVSACTRKAPVVTKDVVEFSHPTAAKLIENLENGARHSITVFVKDSIPQLVKKDDMAKYKVVPDTLLQKLKTLPDTIELYYQVYKGKADKLIQKKQKKPDNLLTVAHGNTGRNYIELAVGKKAYEGDYIAQRSADSLFNDALNKKDSILRANIPEKTYKKLKKYEKDAILSYLYNVNEKLLSLSDPQRAIPESFFECLAKESKGKVQAKFNVTPSHEGAACGLAKRNLVQLLIYGNGQVYNNPHALKNVHRILDIFKQRFGAQRLLDETFELVEKYGVDSTKLVETKKQFLKYLYK